MEMEEAIANAIAKPWRLAIASQAIGRSAPYLKKGDPLIVGHR
jgi:hypothetical protein